MSAPDDARAGRSPTKPLVVNGGHGRDGLQESLDVPGAAVGAVAFVIARARLAILLGDRLVSRRVDEESGSA